MINKNPPIFNREEAAVEVAVPLPIHGTYSYCVPVGLQQGVAVGKRVLVPFGARRVTGFVLGPAEPPPEGRTLKEIAEVLDDHPLFPEAMVPFFRWVADYYIHPLGQVIQAAVPGGLTAAERAELHLTDEGRRVLGQDGPDNTTRAILQRLEASPCGIARLARDTGIRLSRDRSDELIERGWVVRQVTLHGDRTRPKRQRFVLPCVAAQPAAGPQAGRNLSAARVSILELLQTQGPMALSDLKARIPTAGALVRVMARDSQVRVEEREVYRDPLGAPIAPDRPPEPTAEQRQAVSVMGSSLGQGYRTFLLAGVTGSGKTEVYLQLAARALEKNLPVLVLVPEIALITQMERAFRARFGQGVALLHSGLSEGERYDQWRRIAAGLAPVAVGARSAIFAPYGRLGLVIVDEEHDDSYKQEGSLRYHARDLAVVRARQDGALAVLGSATPSVQSAYNAKAGKFTQVDLLQRVDCSALPHIQVQDLTQLREERGARRMLTPALLSAMRETVSRGEQVLLFLNRRGFAGTLICGACGQPLRCDRCDISLTYHQADNCYSCHYCGFSRAAAARCGRCGSSRIKRLGLGTEKLEQEIRALFPAARVGRMDRDTTRRKGSLVQILKSLRDRKIDILIGTQMVAKGHDYPNITLVGIICADLSLSLPDFRAGERTFQLLAQVAGRAGRGQAPGRVVLQTYNPEHFSIAAARCQDCEAFYNQEIEFRRALGYPPFRRMIQLRVNGRDKQATAERARAIGELAVRLRQREQAYSAIDVMGPVEAPLPRIADHYRWQILLKGASAGALRRLAHALISSPQAPPAKSGVTLSVDVDPVFMM